MFSCFMLLVHGWFAIFLYCINEDNYADGDDDSIDNDTGKMKSAQRKLSCSS